jgi:hypothetical protein
MNHISKLLRRLYFFHFTRQTLKQKNIVNKNLQYTTNYIQNFLRNVFNWQVVITRFLQ